MTIRQNDKASDSSGFHKPNMKKDIYKQIESLTELEPGDDKYALGSVTAGGSFFNAFKPKEGVSFMEGLSKFKKGNNFQDSVNHLSRADYSKSFSQQPFELKGILANSQSMGCLGPKKSQQISFYEEDSLPPIISPRDRYKYEKDADETHDLELDQSMIPIKKSEELILRTGDISELTNFDKTFADHTNNNSRQDMTILPKYINR